MKRILASATLLAVAACTPQQIQTAQDYQARVASICVDLMRVPSGPLRPWIVGACGSADAIARIALDPTTLAWLNDLAAKIRAL